MAGKFEVETTKRVHLLRESGYDFESDKSYSVQFIKDGNRFYIKKNRLPAVVLHPDQFNQTDRIMGFLGKKYSNSSLVSFPKQINKGKEAIRYGIGFNLYSDSELVPFLKAAFRK